MLGISFRVQGEITNQQSGTGQKFAPKGRRCDTAQLQVAPPRLNLSGIMIQRCHEPELNYGGGHRRLVRSASNRWSTGHRLGLYASAMGIDFVKQLKGLI